MSRGEDTNRPDPDVAESLRGSNPNAAGPEGLAGGMGISSERLGDAGPDQDAVTDGVRGTGPKQHPDPDARPEQSADGQEPANTARMGRKSDYPSADPRSRGEDPDERGSGLRRSPERPEE